jgi:hypothetical protein
MPLTLSPAAGDGVTQPAWRVNVAFPDSGTTITINGSYQAPSLGVNPPALQSPVNFTTGTVTSPGVPGSGSNYWICEVNLTTGALLVKSSTTATPLPDAGNAVVFSQTIASTASSAPSLQGSITFPWL